MRIQLRSQTNVFLALGAVAAAGLVGAAWRKDAARLRESKQLRRIMIDVLLNALSSGDAFTERHSRRVANLTDVLSCALALDKKTRARLRIASLLHDMGKIDDRFFQILHSCDPLDARERAKIKQHPHESAHILKPLERIYPGITYIVESHHERWDGKGYPRGLKGGKIPLEARMISVADVFDAMSQPRPYKRPESVDNSFGEIRVNAGKRFDPGLVELLDRSDVRGAFTRIARRGVATEKLEKAKAKT